MKFLVGVMLKLKPQPKKLDQFQTMQQSQK